MCLAKRPLAARGASCYEGRRKRIPALVTGTVFKTDGAAARPSPGGFDSRALPPLHYFTTSTWTEDTRRGILEGYANQRKEAPSNMMMKTFVRSGTGRWDEQYSDG